MSGLYRRRLNTSRIHVVELPEAHPQVSVVAAEKLVKPVFDDGHFVGCQLTDQIRQQLRIGSAFDQRRQSSGTVQGDDQRTGATRLVKESPPTDGA
jgi:hypothetical protein